MSRKKKRKRLEWKKLTSGSFCLPSIFAGHLDLLWIRIQIFEAVTFLFSDFHHYLPPWKHIKSSWRLLLKLLFVFPLEVVRQSRENQKPVTRLWMTVESLNHSIMMTMLNQQFRKLEPKTNLTMPKKRWSRMKSTAMKIMSHVLMHSNARKPSSRRKPPLSRKPGSKFYIYTHPLIHN